MSEQQQFQPGDRVKVTMELTVVAPGGGGHVTTSTGTVYPSIVRIWADECDHIDVELIERPEPPREPGLYLCKYNGISRPVLWDGAEWRWPGGDGRVVSFQDDVHVLGTVTLDEGVEL